MVYLKSKGGEGKVVHVSSQDRHLPAVLEELANILRHKKLDVNSDQLREITKEHEELSEIKDKGDSDLVSIYQRQKRLSDKVISLALMQIIKNPVVYDPEVKVCRPQLVKKKK